VSSKTRKLRRSAKKKELALEQLELLGQPQQPVRVHLTLIDEPSSGQKQLQLVRPVFREDWLNRMTEATANTAYASLNDQLTVEATVELGQHVMDASSRLTQGLLARVPEGTVACRAGCSHCCHQRVGVTPPEAFAIFHHLLETRDRAQLARLFETVITKRRHTHGLSAQERLSPLLPCPFLQANSCSIYEVRPLSCRGVNSLDERVCAAKLHDPLVRDAYFRGELPGHSFQEPIQAVHAISAGLQLALSEQLGLDMRPLELIAALSLLLEEYLQPPSAALEPTPSPSNTATRWLMRQPTLQAARDELAADPGQSAALAQELGLAHGKRPD